MLCPSIGGSIISWSIDDQDMLRRTDAEAIKSAKPTRLASFPLVPFSNRIGNARFNWRGRQIDLARNFAPEPHAIHGTGWQNAWAVEAHDVNYCKLMLRHEGDDTWPWSFSASQCFTLKHNMLEMNLSATNLSSEPAPLAFGHHPYFDADGAHLTFDAARILLTGDDALPTKAVLPRGRFDFSRNGMIAGRQLDHCYTGWDGHACIQWTGRPRALEIEADMAAVVVYIPSGENSFCFEPVPHINNALNFADDVASMPTITPGESFTATIRLSAI